MQIETAVRSPISGKLLNATVTTGMFLLAFGTRAEAQTYNYTALDDPSAVYGTTYAQGVSGSSIVGYYDNANGDASGFLYNMSNGTYTTINEPLALTGYGGTALTAISGSNVVGNYCDISGLSRGFVYNLVSGTYATIEAPGSGPNNDLSTVADGISGNTVVGYDYFDGGINEVDFSGFVDGVSGYQTFEAPNGRYQGYVCTGIDGNLIVGQYYGYVPTGSPPAISPSNNGNGFVYDEADGSLTKLLPSLSWAPNGISGSEIVGNALNQNDGSNMAIFADNGTYTTLTDPAAEPGSTYVCGVDGNTVVGYYYDSDMNAHGFFATVPEPSSTLFCAATVVAVLGRRKVRRGS